MIFRFIGAQWLAGLFVAIVSFLISILIARALGPDEFGIYSIALSVGAILAILIDGGFGKLLQRERAQASTTITDEVSNKLPGLACGHVIKATFLFSLLVVLVLPSKAHTLVAAIFFFGVTVLNQLGLAILRGDGRLVRDASWQIGNRSFTAVCVLLATYYFDASQPWHIFLALLWGGLAFSTLVLRYLRVRPNFKLFPKIYLLVLPFVWLDFSSAIYFRADMILLGWFKVPKVDIGHYGVAYRLMEAVMLFSLPFSILLLRKFRLDTVNMRRFLRLAIKSAVIGGLIGGGIYLFFQFWSRELIGLAYGPQFINASHYLGILMAALIFMLPNLVLMQAALALNLEKGLAIAATIAAIANIACNSIFIPIYGPTSAAWVTVLTEALLFLLIIMVIANRASANPQLRSDA